jgi:hypothetical protein
MKANRNKPKPGKRMPPAPPPLWAWRLRNTAKKRKRLPKQLRATFGPMPTPERIRTYRLYNAITAALAQLAQLASDSVAGQELEYPSLAPSCLCSVLLDSARKAVAILSKTPDTPNGLPHDLTFAMTTAVREFGEAVDRHPAQFQQPACQQVEWPVLRTVGSKGGKRDPFPNLADKLGLGAYAGIKRDGAIDFTSVANRETVSRLLRIVYYKKWALPPNKIKRESWAEKESWEKQLLTTEFPRLTKEPGVLRLWFERGVKPLLEREKGELFETTLRAERDRQRARGKTDAKTWSYFLKSCQDALESLAPAE